MNRDRFHGIWKQFRGKVKELWGTLTRDPLTVTAGTRVWLAGKIQERRAILKTQADRQLEDFMHRNRRWSDISSP